MTIEQMADEARKTVFQHINRSTGQHLRAMRSAATLKALDEIYNIGCKYAITNADMRPLCEIAGVDFAALMNHQMGTPAAH
jgi:hypothetical protein